MSSLPVTALRVEPDAALRHRLDDALDRALADARMVGAVVLVAQDGELRYARAVGLADREAGTPMRDDALFRLSSVTKPVVAAAAMRLVAAGRIALDEPVARSLPGFRPTLADGTPAVITLRHLLSHTAGLGYRFLEADGDGPYARAGVSDGMDRSGLSLAENLRRIASVPLQFAPGTSWGYSLSMDVVGALIEAVDGRPLADAVAALVTTPLGMTDTAFVAHDAARFATPYVSTPGAPRRMADVDLVPVFDGTIGIRFEPARVFDADAWPSGGAGMVGTARDCVTLLDALRTGRDGWLEPAWVDEMARVQPGARELRDAPSFGFGLGFSVLRDPVAAQSPESVGTWRGGGAYGHTWFVDRAAGLTAVALTNTLYEGLDGRIVTAVRDAVYGVETGGAA
ncbi:class A beta-lactamase-related serine hydrolase [Burkholderia cepacia]|uniref:Class A beta-lactamase-related serine hydrolase n=1 Tax=Burkholderia cepacia TaxID=292 RepID=A0AAX2RIG7_BURCE|nr:serine hydrolase domain-containing protein [Burkholderia cepacia]TES72093.1 class A beta-lactamase-related serine hydrolase [Burkholderia cepacia]TET03348.1 class A beta-lactamase-related serine hydrolase [Burkholderia cepacia]TEU38586.1 class A beta-lactamase-related serine hydrolase [Burkholderia cepacia]TEU43484.1 class A beta-lactamase-related serine hydrolase [Burkholderia cepacia]TEU54875.1 class A beta-lactamase-related serine hydrolase [Burkholderia cepacia]